MTKDGIYIEWKVFGLTPSSKIYNNEEFNYIGKLFNRDLAKLYSEADIVLCPSWYESFPLPPIEAMACGALVVTTRYGTEDYAFDGINSLVTKPRNIEEMSNKIMNAIKNPDKIKKLVENSIAIGRKFNWDESTNNLETIFKNAQQRYLGYKERSVNFIDRLIRGIF